MKKIDFGIIPLIAFLHLGISGCREPVRKKAFEPEPAEWFQNLTFASSTQIRTATRDAEQFSLYVEREEELKLLSAAASFLKAVPELAEKFQIEKFKSRSLAYFRYSVGMSESQLACYDSHSKPEFSDVSKALTFFSDHLRRRTECLYTLVDNIRLDSLFRARPEFRRKPDTCSSDCELDYKSAFSLSSDPILEALFGDSINKTSKRAWASLRARERIRFVEKIGKQDLEGDFERILAYRNDQPLLTAGEMRNFLRFAPQDSGYLNRLKDYAENIVIWKLGAEEFERLELQKHPAIQSFVSRKDEEFWAYEYRTRHFREEEKKSKAAWVARAKRGMGNDFQLCQAISESFVPGGYHMLGLLPEEFLQANLVAGLAGSDTSRPAELQCREALEKANIVAFESAEAKWLDQLRAKYERIAAGFSPYLMHFMSFTDTLDYLHAKYQEGKFVFVAQTLQKLSLQYFSDKAKFTEIGIFQARHAIQSRDFRNAAFYLERVLQLYPTAPEKPLRLLLALYKHDYRNEQRLNYWKLRYKALPFGNPLPAG